MFTLCVPIKLRTPRREGFQVEKNMVPQPFEKGVRGPHRPPESPHSHRTIKPFHCGIKALPVVISRRLHLNCSCHVPSHQTAHTAR